MRDTPTTETIFLRQERSALAARSVVRELLLFLPFAPLMIMTGHHLISSGPLAQWDGLDWFIIALGVAGLLGGLALVGSYSRFAPIWLFGEVLTPEALIVRRWGREKKLRWEHASISERRRGSLTTVELWTREPEAWFLMKLRYLSHDEVEILRAYHAAANPDAPPPHENHLRTKNGRA